MIKITLAVVNEVHEDEGEWEVSVASEVVDVEDGEEVGVGGVVGVEPLVVVTVLVDVVALEIICSGVKQQAP